MFRVKNLGAADVELDIVAADGFEGFVGRMQLGGDGLPTVLKPGEERSVAIKLGIPNDAVPGDYAGIVRVSATDGSFSADIPVLVTVAGKDDKKGGRSCDASSSRTGAGRGSPKPANRRSGPE